MANHQKLQYHLTSSNLKDNLYSELGDGYNSDRQTLTLTKCLNEYNSTFTGNKEINYFTKPIEFSDLEVRLNTNILQYDSIDIFSKNSAATYARYVRETPYTKSFYFVESVDLPSASINIKDVGDVVLNQIGKDIYSQGPDKFRQICGDQYITEQSLGERIYTTIRINFHTADYKNEYMDSLPEINDLSTALTTMLSTFSKISLNRIPSSNADIEVSTLQLGGDSNQLTQIFNSCGEHYCIVSCTFINLNPCQNIINNIVNYASNNGDFIKQVNFQDGEIIGNAVVTGVQYNLFSNLKLDVGPSIINDTIVEARQTLGQTYYDIKLYKTQLDQLLNKSPVSTFLSDAPTKFLLSQEQSNAEFNTRLMQDSDKGVISCFINPEACPNIEKNILNNLKSLTPTIINQFKTGYFCPMTSTITSNFHDPAGCWPIGSNKYIVIYQAQEFIYTIIPTGNDLTIKVNEQLCVAKNIGPNNYIIEDVCNDCAKTIPYITYGNDQGGFLSVICPSMFHMNDTTMTIDNFSLNLTVVDLGWI